MKGLGFISRPTVYCYNTTASVSQCKSWRHFFVFQDVSQNSFIPYLQLSLASEMTPSTPYAPRVRGRGCDEKLIFFSLAQKASPGYYLEADGEGLLRLSGGGYEVLRNVD